MKIDRCIKHVCLAAAICLLVSGCTPVKLTTVRPAEISRLLVERVEDGATAELPGDKGDADAKNALIFQLEEPYERTGGCDEGDGHKYRVSLYIMDKLDTEVMINADGSVCRRGGRYIPSDMAEEPVDMADWDALFD